MMNFEAYRVPYKGYIIYTPPPCTVHPRTPVPYTPVRHVHFQSVAFLQSGIETAEMREQKWLEHDYRLTGSKK